MGSLRNAIVRRRWWAASVALIAVAALASTASMPAAAVPADQGTSDARAFVLRRGHFTSLGEAPGAVSTGHAALNDRGQVVGFYAEADGTLHGFVR
jgi:hypothetical protein